MNERHPFNGPQLQRSRVYTGPLDRMTFDKVEALFREAHRYFGERLPGPPTGLPGRGVVEVDPDVMQLIDTANEYGRAAAERKPRAMINRYYDVQEMLRDAYRKGRSEGQEEAMRLWDARFDRQTSDSTTDPQKRLRTLQTSNPLRLSILAVTTGGQRAERAYHARFAEHRRQGEWFDRAPDIVAEIARLQEQAS